MKQQIINDSMVITPSEGYLLTFRGDPEGRSFSRIIQPKDRNINNIIEIIDTNIPIYIPQYEEDIFSFNLGELQQYIADQTKILLKDFLEENPLLFKGKYYNVSSESQNHLASIIKAAEMAKNLNIFYQPQWNAVNEARTNYDLKTLQELFIKIQEYVGQFVIQQQKMEQKIFNITDRVELQNFNIKYIKED